MRFSKRKLHSLFLLFLCCARETEKKNKTNWERSKNPVIIVFLGWFIQK